MIPTSADGVILAPIVIKINPKPTWKKPAKNPKKIYPNKAKNNIWRDIIKLVFATVVLYIAKTYPQKPKDNTIPPIIPAKPVSYTHLRAHET